MVAPERDERTSYDAPADKLGIALMVKMSTVLSELMMDSAWAGTETQRGSGARNNEAIGRTVVNINEYSPGFRLGSSGNFIGFFSGENSIFSVVKLFHWPFS